MSPPPTAEGTLAEVASPTGMSPLAGQLAQRIARMIESGRLGPDDHVREQKLARAFSVSRSPVREALTALAQMHVLVHRRGRGFFVAEGGRALDAALRLLSSVDEDAPYREIAARRLAGDLPAQFTEADLGRMFSLSRAQTGRITARMAQEGWIEPKAGYGWSFAPVLTTPDAFARLYRFRLALEPEALLEPTFAVDAAAFACCREEQEAIVDGRVPNLDPARLFDLGSGFHETLMRCSGNPFFLDAIQRVNRMRRLIEYRAMVEPGQFRDQARQHLEILRLLEAGDRGGAALRLRRHLDEVREVKLHALERADLGDGARAHGQVASMPLHF